MKLWDLNIKEYLEELRQLDEFKKSEYLKVTENAELIILFERYAEKAKQVVRQITPTNFGETISELLDLDARLFYVLIELCINDGQRTDKAIITEFERFYASEYFDASPILPFSKLRLIGDLKKF